MANKTKKRANSFNTGVAAESFVLSQLYRLEKEAYVSQGNKKTVDIRVVISHKKAISIDVKAVRGYSSLVVNNVKSQKNHFIAFVIYHNKFKDLEQFPSVYIVPSGKVPEITKQWKNEKRVMKTDLEKYLNNWESLC